MTRFTEYALRALICLAERPDRICSISEIATAIGAPHDHLSKVVHRLGKTGYVTGLRGRSGGIVLARPPDQIKLGAIVKDMEPCTAFRQASPAAIDTSPLQEALAQSLDMFFAALDRYSLKDLADHQSD
ncbi:Rrf2 family transcriptional regulator [Sphingomonas sp. MMS24-J13]|uniref:Rrf2 family transcriptional regulator n=1 Tax=Sphingomonas sp. MMS24-J13 TaxID=3238686 RepID=UPI00384D67AC